MLNVLHYQLSGIHSTILIETTMASNELNLLIEVQVVLQELIRKVEYVSSQQQVGKRLN